MANAPSELMQQQDDPVWFVEERQLNGDWIAIDRADDHRSEVEPCRELPSRHVPSESVGLVSPATQEPSHPGEALPSSSRSCSVSCR